MLSRWKKFALFHRIDDNDTMIQRKHSNTQCVQMNVLFMNCDIKSFVWVDNMNDECEMILLTWILMNYSGMRTSVTITLFVKLQAFDLFE